MCLGFRQFLSKQVKVRKPRMCGWCGHKIEGQEIAHYRVYIFDDELTRDWMHLECHTAMNNSKNEYLCDGWMPGDFERGVAAL